MNRETQGHTAVLPPVPDEPRRGHHAPAPWWRRGLDSLTRWIATHATAFWGTAVVLAAGAATGGYIAGSIPAGADTPPPVVASRFPAEDDFPEPEDEPSPVPTKARAPGTVRPVPVVRPRPTHTKSTPSPKPSRSPKPSPTRPKPTKPSPPPNPSGPPDDQVPLPPPVSTPEEGEEG